MGFLEGTTVWCLGSTSTDCTINENGTIDRDTLYSTLSTTVTTVTAGGLTKVVAMEDSIAYVESMSQEELGNFEQLIEAKEQELNIEEKGVKVYTKGKQI